MKIKLIQPKMHKRPVDTDLKVLMSPLLSLLTLKKLTPADCTVIIENENIKPIDYNQKVDLVAISLTVDVSQRAFKIAEKFRQMNIPVVGGGIHVTCSPESCEKHFDALCIGMAERVWHKIIEDVQKGALQKRYLDMENIKGAEIVSPDFSAVYKKDYLYTNILTTSRGCPHKCDFCYNSGAKVHSPYITRPIKDVIKEIESLESRHVIFVDDNFIGSPQYTKELLTALKNKKLKWNAAVTTSIVKHLDLLDLMQQTGCQSLFIGLESISAQSINSVHKVQNNVADYEVLLDEIHQRGIMVNASIVFGLDHDTKDIFKTTLDFLVKYKVETATVHILTPYPGTVLYEKMLASGRIVDFESCHYNTAHVVFKPQSMTAQELKDGYLWFYKEFYSWKNIFWRLPNSKKQWVAYLLFNFFYRKYGNFTSFLTRFIPIRFIGKISSWFSYLRN